MPISPENRQNSPPAGTLSTTVISSVRCTRRCSVLRSPRSAARVISGISRVLSVARNENGKNTTGMAMPRSAPYCARPTSRLAAATARQEGTITFSTVRRKLVRYWLAAMGASPCTMAHGGMCGFCGGPSVRLALPQHSII